LPGLEVRMEKIIIFTDLDGTLLHPKTYSFQEAMPALTLIRERKVPLVLCSSKTRAEIEVWRTKLGNNHPFITENGGGIFAPVGYFPVTTDDRSSGDYVVRSIGAPYDSLRKEFVRLRSVMSIRVRGFGDMTAQEIAALTGLTLEESYLAKEREFDEPFMFEEKDPAKEKEFLQAIEAAGFFWTRGRFHHMTGDNDKGRAVSILKEQYEARLGRVTTIGLGDSLNDLPLLRVVDQPVLVRKEDGIHEPGIILPNLIRSSGMGPEGWNDAVLRILGA
jgi:mannosyl-3-phosphoglycerate phosphatase family protein